MHGSNLKLFYWIIGSRVYKPFGMRNGCREIAVLHFMHGSRVYEPFGMRNGCRINNNLYTGCTAAVYINFFAWATAAVRLVVLYRISFGSRV